MCGRFINLNKTNAIKKIFEIKSSLNKDLISYNIAPQQYSYIITNVKKISIENSKWGLSYIDKNNNKINIINSRIETIREKLILFYLIQKIV